MAGETVNKRSNKNSQAWREGWDLLALTKRKENNNNPNTNKYINKVSGIVEVPLFSLLVMILARTVLPRSFTRDFITTSVHWLVCPGRVTTSGDVNLSVFRCCLM